MNTAFETLAQGAVDHNSRKIAHRITKEPLFVTGSENLERARKEITRLEEKYATRRERYEWAVNRRKAAQERLNDLRLDQELNGTKPTAEAGELMSEMDTLDKQIAEWTELEPGFLAHIEAERRRVDGLETEVKKAEVALLLDTEKAVGIELFNQLESLVGTYRRLHKLIGRKQELQAMLGNNRDGIGGAPSLKLSGDMCDLFQLSSGDTRDRIAEALEEVKKRLLIG